MLSSILATLQGRSGLLLSSNSNHNSNNNNNNNNNSEASITCVELLTCQAVF